MATELKPTQRFLKTQAELNCLPPDSEDVYLQSKFEIYLQRNPKLNEITYPMYFQWWRKSTYSEQCKAEKGESKGSSPTIGFKGTDELVELKQSIQDRKNVIAIFKERLVNLTDKLKDKTVLQNAALLIIRNKFNILILLQALVNICKHWGMMQKIMIVIAVIQIVRKC